MYTPARDRDENQNSRTAHNFLVGITVAKYEVFSHVRSVGVDTTKTYCSGKNPRGRERETDTSIPLIKKITMRLEHTSFDHVMRDVIP